MRVEVWDSKLTPWNAAKSVHAEGGFARNNSRIAGRPEAVRGQLTAISNEKS